MGFVRIFVCFIHVVVCTCDSSHHLLCVCKCTRILYCYIQDRLDSVVHFQDSKISKLYICVRRTRIQFHFLFCSLLFLFGKKWSSLCSLAFAVDLLLLIGPAQKVRIGYVKLSISFGQRQNENEFVIRFTFNGIPIPFQMRQFLYVKTYPKWSNKQLGCTQQQIRMKRMKK